MTLLRNIWADLLEKKLWPVAILLIVALAAIPAVLGGGGETAASDQASAPVPPAGQSGPAKASEAVSLEAPTTGKVHRAGKGRNPFIQHHQPKPTKIAAPSPSTSPSTAAPSPTSESGSSGGASAPSTPSTPVTAKPTKTTYSVDLAFGEIDVTKNYKNVARLTPLPSSDNPFFVFLGVSDDGKSATFMVTSDADPSGDGHCTPSRQDCETVTLKPGDTEFFDMQSGTAGIVTYQLDLKRIRKRTVASTAKAAVVHARESRAGRDVLRTLLAADPKALGGWTFESQTGLLVNAHAVGAGHAAATPKAGDAVARPRR